MSMTLNLGALSPDISDLVRQLKADMKDDWYPDSLGFEDILTTETASSLLEGCFRAHHGLFVPAGRIELNIPKRGFVLRYSLESNVTDRLYYQALVSYLIPYFDTLLPQQVLSHRHAATGPRAGRYLFKQPIEQWKFFGGYVAEESKDKPVILVTDIQNYFENIEIDHIVGVLEENVANIKCDAAEKSHIRRVIYELQRCLRMWCYTQAHGLPQNRDASSFLANIAMLPIDKAMLAAGYAYYRYMDDIRIATDSKYQARSALQALVGHLRRHGLSVNAAKTCIFEPMMSNYGEALTHDDSRLAQIDNMWKSKSLPVIRRSFAPLRRLATDLIGRGATQERAFRFCIQRFENMALCPEVGVPDAYFEPMVDACVRELDAQPFSSDQIVRLLKATSVGTQWLGEITKLLCDDKRAIYDWQNYLLWQLLVHKKFRHQDLLDAARVRLERDDRRADRAGAILYLGAIGDADVKMLIARSFPTFKDHLVQRSALVAMHELDFRDIKPFVSGNVLPCLDGTYKRLRDTFFGQYFRPLPSVHANVIYDEVSAYD